MLKIGNLTLKTGKILAPMAGITDFPFRMLARKFGCELAFVEMINCRSISHKSVRTKQMLSSHPKDRPLGVQLLGCEDKFILKAIEVLKGYKFDLLDFNAACPAKKVVRRGEGASLLKEPEKLHELLKLIVKNSPFPVSVKIRIGWDEHSINAREVALLAEDAGVKALFVHGRTKAQGYSGEVNYAAIARVKAALKIPVIASGNIFSNELAQKMLSETHCDAVAVARGSLGNPWIFNAGAPIPAEVIKVMAEHLNANVQFYGERVGVMKFRKFVAWYTKGWRKVRQLREKSSRVKKKEEMLALIENCRL
ncbi:MAG: tRNA dihydrouridine synthase DusB [Candidatus Omnitrophica bacterium]|nr:tRNA dihydrouridine synthase DusB [Candidatus Omnitrophota bacterium]MDD5653819.1 tRNA dihydrouridine synthase DusB [Candidatus Omnitrophota bacterium]